MNNATLQSHQEIEIGKWKGLFTRGETDAVPPGYFTDCLNVTMIQDQVQSRNGFQPELEFVGILRYFIYRRLNEASRFLYLDTTGALYDSLYPGTPLITNVSFIDFSAVNINNRCYISFHNRVHGITSTFIYVYEGDGPGTLRKAAGTAPSGFTLSVSTAAGSGNFEAGTYLFAVAYETASGYITMPGPELFTVYVAPGDYAVDIANLPIGPTGTVGRYLICTQALPEYNGNQFGYEFFFVPGGHVEDNSTTTISGLSVFSDELIDSADYLFYNLPELPAALGLTTYNGRMIYWTGDHDIWVSKKNEPESFDGTNGFITVDKSNVISGVTNAIDFRGQLYITKASGSYVTQDNDDDPITWVPESVDAAVGTQVNGISRLQGNKGTNVNRFFLADVSGLRVFESGSFRYPQMSWNIEDTWKRINLDYFDLVQVDHDEEAGLVYVAVPLDTAFTLSHLLVANYQNAFDQYGNISPRDVKWSIWNFPDTLTSITVTQNADGIAVLSASGLTTGIFYQDPTSHNDDTAGINAYIETYLIDKSPNWIHHYPSLKMRCRGNGDMAISMYSPRHVKSLSISDEVLESSPEHFIYRVFNFKADKASFKLGTSDANSWFILNELLIKCKPLWYSVSQ